MFTLSRLKRWLSFYRPRVPPIVLVGDAGVGKSTLLNAFLGDRCGVLPRGGVGPLTALPVRVYYAKQPFIKIRTHGVRALRRLIRAVERDGHAGSLSTMKAQLLVQGSQYGRVKTEHVIECLKSASKRRIHPAADQAERGRLTRLVELITTKSSLKVIALSADARPLSSKEDLALYCAGHLSPMVKNVEIGLDSEPLRDGLNLIDLPGVGTANDVYLSEIREVLVSARRVLLVVDRSGPSEQALHLLESFLADFVRSPRERFLAIAVVKLDLVVDDRKRDDLSGRSWTNHLERVRSEAITTMRKQIEIEIIRTSDRLRVSRQKALRAAEHIRVEVVLPVEHLRHHRQDPEDRPRIKSSLDSGVQRLRDILRAA